MVEQIVTPKIALSTSTSPRLTMNFSGWQYPLPPSQLCVIYMMTNDVINSNIMNNSLVTQEINILGRFKSSVYLIASISFGMVSDTSSTIVSICLFLLQFKPTCSLIIKVKYISTRNNCIWFCLVIIVSKMVKMHVFNLETYWIWMRACFRFVFFSYNSKLPYEWNNMYHLPGFIL